MLAAQIRQDVIANNLANATNPGFKGDVAVAHAFDDMLLDQVRTGRRIGPVSTGTRVTEIATDASQGSLRATRNPLDVAVGGPGWLSVATPAGVAYTRNGALTVDAQGRMVTAQGDPVLGTDGQALVVGGGEVAIDRQGRVSAAGRAVGQLALTALVPDSLRKQGSNYVQGTVDPARSPRATSRARTSTPCARWWISSPTCARTRRTRRSSARSTTRSAAPPTR
jgi:flagellar basal-body rod protein FlgG